MASLRTQLTQVRTQPLQFGHVARQRLEPAPANVVWVGNSTDGPEMQRWCLTHLWASAPDHRIPELEQCPDCTGVLVSAWYRELGSVRFRVLVASLKER